jgi:DNA replication protein DnaC
MGAKQLRDVCFDLLDLRVERLDQPDQPERDTATRRNRTRRRTARRVKAAGFPRDKWLGNFDFAANPNVNPATIHTLATAAWVRTGQPLCLIGDSGTGKSHLLIGLGTAAAEAGFRVKYTLATRWSTNSSKRPTR